MSTTGQLQVLGLQYLLEVALSKVQSAPSNFYLGLYKNGSLPAKDAILSAITEVTGTGYARQAIPASAVGFPTSAQNGNYKWDLTAAAKVFTATGGPWDGATGWFLATSSDGSGILIACGALAATRTLQVSGDTETVTATFELTA